MKWELVDDCLIGDGVYLVRRISTARGRAWEACLYGEELAEHFQTLESATGFCETHAGQQQAVA